MKLGKTYTPVLLRIFLFFCLYLIIHILSFNFLQATSFGNTIWLHLKWYVYFLMFLFCYYVQKKDPINRDVFFLVMCYSFISSLDFIYMFMGRGTSFPELYKWAVYMNQYQLFTLGFLALAFIINILMKVLEVRTYTFFVSVFIAAAISLYIFREFRNPDFLYAVVEKTEDWKNFYAPRNSALLKMNITSFIAVCVLYLAYVVKNTPIGRYVELFLLGFTCIIVLGIIQAKFFFHVDSWEVLAFYNKNAHVFKVIFAVYFLLSSIARFSWLYTKKGYKEERHILSYPVWKHFFEPEAGAFSKFIVKLKPVYVLVSFFTVFILFFFLIFNLSLSRFNEHSYVSLLLISCVSFLLSFLVVTYRHRRVNFIRY